MFHQIQPKHLSTVSEALGPCVTGHTFKLPTLLTRLKISHQCCWPPFSHFTKNCYLWNNDKESGSLVTKCVLCKSSGKCNQYPAVALKMQLTSLITIHQ